MKRTKINLRIWIRAGIAILLIVIVIIYIKIWSDKDTKSVSSDAMKGIVSFFLADVDQDGDQELLTIEAYSESQRTEEGAYYGNVLCIADEFSLDDDKTIVLDKTDSYRFDMGNDKPLRVQVGDIDGDGNQEISVVTYKTTKFHPVLQKRPFFYRLTEGKLEKVWLGSRLSRPFLDFALFDVDQDQIDEIVAIEYDQDGQELVAVYDWEGFGFDLKYDYPKDEDEIVFPTGYHEHLQSMQIKGGKK